MCKNTLSTYIKINVPHTIIEFSTACYIVAETNAEYFGFLCIGKI